MGILSARPEPTATAEDPLARLLAPIESLPGLRKPELLARAAGGGRVLDLLLHLPERVQHRLLLEFQLRLPRSILKLIIYLQQHQVNSKQILIINWHRQCMKL